MTFYDSYKLRIFLLSQVWAQLKNIVPFTSLWHWKT